MGRLWQMALGNVGAARTRTLWIFSSFAVGAAVFVLMSSLAAGLSATLKDTASTLFSGHINVGGVYRTSTRGARSAILDVHALRREVAAALPEARVLDRVKKWLQFSAEEGSMRISLTGIDPREEEGLLARLVPISGDPSKIADGPGLVLFENQAKRLGVGSGDVVTVMAQGRGAAQAEDMVVCAVVADLGVLSRFKAFTNKAQLRRFLGLRSSVSSLLQIYLPDDETAPAVRAGLAASLVKAGYPVLPYDPAPLFRARREAEGRGAWHGQALALNVWQDELLYVVWLVRLLENLTELLLLPLAVLIVVGLGHHLIRSVAERTAEIGTLRALGMKRRGVLVLLVLEATILGVGGALVGAAFAVAVAAFLNGLQLSLDNVALRTLLLSDALHLAGMGPAALRSILLFGGLSVVAAIGPAWRAARLPPRVAMAHVG